MKVTKKYLGKTANDWLEGAKIAELKNGFFTVIHDDLPGVKLIYSNQEYGADLFFRKKKEVLAVLTMSKKALVQMNALLTAMSELYEIKRLEEIAQEKRERRENRRIEKTRKQ
jgi:hypothetical protein